MMYLLDQKSKDKVLDSLAKLDGSRAWDITVEPHRKQRSISANRRLWALHALAAEVTGYSVAEMHEFALCRHFGHKDIKVGKLTLRVPMRRSSTRNVKEFAELMESTEEWYISEFGVWLE